MKKFGFSAKFRLSDFKAIRIAFKKKAFYTDGVKLFVCENELGYNRYLCTFRRNFATAVKRNSIRRHCREYLRHVNMLLKQGYDFVFLFNDSKVEPVSAKKSLQVLLEKAGF
ncbi:MAG: ribonuclease P protein component [Treponemataceae bacterium]